MNMLCELLIKRPSPSALDQIWVSASLYGITIFSIYQDSCGGGSPIWVSRDEYAEALSYYKESKYYDE
uniref:Uncharacterized protein n=1 Tax=Leviviridae sp. TaxID=2027243 RepID=A0A514D1M3_9VIRU|nr:MAG: hypothetical protein H4Rhizo454787e1005_000001 [Leviviridae sp.]